MKPLFYGSWQLESRMSVCKNIVLQLQPLVVESSLYMMLRDHGPVAIHLRGCHDEKTISCLRASNSNFTIVMVLCKRHASAILVIVDGWHACCFSKGRKKQELALKL